MDRDAIRARDAAALAAAKAGLNLPLADLAQAPADRHDLLAEVDRLRRAYEENVAGYADAAAANERARALPVIEAARHISRPTYVDDERVVAHIPYASLTALRAALARYEEVTK